MGGRRSTLASWVRPYLPARAGRCGRGRAGRSRGRPRRRCRRSRPRCRGWAARRPASGRRRRRCPGVGAGVVGVEEGGLVLGAGVPAGAVQQPAALGQAAVVASNASTSSTVSRWSGSAAARSAWSMTTAGPTSRPGGTWLTSSWSLPVTQWMGASKWVPVCSPLQGVPVPGGPALVVVGQLPQPEPGRVGERLGQAQDRRLLRQRLGQVDHLDLPGGQGGDQVLDGVGHGGAPWGWGVGSQVALELEAVLEHVQVHVEALGPDRLDLGDQAGQLGAADRRRRRLPERLQVGDGAGVGDPGRPGDAGQVGAGGGGGREPAHAEQALVVEHDVGEVRGRSGPGWSARPGSSAPSRRRPAPPPCARAGTGRCPAPSRRPAPWRAPGRRSWAGAPASTARPRPPP